MVPLTFGSGLDRLSGAAVVDPSAHVDLRNVYLSRGRLETRRGLPTLAAPFGTDVLAVVPVRKTGLSAVVLYDASSRVVKLYSYDGATTFSLVGTLWTVDVAVAGHLPRVSIAEVYSQLVIAHDEPLFQYRGNTKAFDVTASTVGDLSLNLDRAGSNPVKFRGVAKHLAYLVGWGYGTASDPDRAETFRVSMPGDPLTFVPEHYFIVGSQGDPIIGGRPLVQDDVTAGGFAIGKDAEWWLMFGTSRADFGIRSMDSEFGLLTSRAHASHVGEVFFWSASGPRSTTGGPSVDLGLPLDLSGPLPDAAAATNDRGFAWVDPVENEVVFCFGTFAYVLHLKDTPRRWSYRTFGVELNAVGFLFPANGTGKLNPIVPTIGTVTTTAPTYLPGFDVPTVTVPWTLAGSATGTEKVEVWVRHELFGDFTHLIRGSWVLASTVAASALTTTFTVPYYMTHYDVAVRVIAGNTPGAGYTGTPDTWPDGARSFIVTAGAITTFDLGGLWERRSATVHGVPFTYVGPGCTETVAGITAVDHPELTFTYEQSVDAGSTWQQHAAGSYRYTPPLAGSVHGNNDKLLTIRYRLTVSGPSASAGPTSGTADIVLAPGAPTISLIAANTGELQFDRDVHPVTVVVGTHGGEIQVRVRHDPDGSWSPTYTVPGGVVEAVCLLDNTGGLDDVRVEATTHLSFSASGLPPGAAAGVGTFGVQSVDDYSTTTVATASF